MPTAPYKNTTSGEIRQLDTDMVAVWIASSNPKISVWKPYAFTQPPAHNTATQKAVPAADIDVNGTLTQQWAIVPLSQEELDAVALENEKTILAQAIAVFDARTATNAQVQRAIAYLLRKLQ